MRQIKISSGSWQKDLEMVVTVIDEDKFKKSCEQINKFYSGDEYRADIHGSHEKAGFAMFCAECFQQIAFNNFKDEEWLTEQFDWSKDKGIDGYPSLDDMGIRIDEIEPWFIDSDDIEIAGW
ncbi:DUF2528 family protein [Proteus sp. G2662]|uniref:DUF2528 family protein n=1 Tax=Proteus sp. G2662 TaxID=2698875 RepID=UPI001378CCB6|nr:DUF2528 family protein [Proteus sp. G2662]NBM95146.1 DUF2528 family protein [Proteus sp. G2662]